MGHRRHLAKDQQPVCVQFHGRCVGLWLPRGDGGCAHFVCIFHTQRPRSLAPQPKQQHRVRRLVGFCRRLVTTATETGDSVGECWPTTKGGCRQPSCECAHRRLLCCGAAETLTWMTKRSWMTFLAACRCGLDMDSTPESHTHILCTHNVASACLHQQPEVFFRSGHCSCETETETTRKRNCHSNELL